MALSIYFHIDLSAISYHPNLIKALDRKNKALIRKRSCKFKKTWISTKRETERQRDFEWYKIQNKQNEHYYKNRTRQIWTYWASSAAAKNSSLYFVVGKLAIATGSRPWNPLSSCTKKQRNGQIHSQPSPLNTQRKFIP